MLPPAAVAEIAEGMSRREVVAILGEPIITSLFNGNRWDYVYSINRSGEKPKPQRVTVFFENDRVSSLEKEGIPEAG